MKSHCVFTLTNAISFLQCLLLLFLPPRHSELFKVTTVSVSTQVIDTLVILFEKKMSDLKEFNINLSLV